jgi:hypothetical protein
MPHYTEASDEVMLYIAERYLHALCLPNQE